MSDPVVDEEPRADGKREMAAGSWQLDDKAIDLLLLLLPWPQVRHTVCTVQYLAAVVAAQRATQSKDHLDFRYPPPTQQETVPAAAAAAAAAAGGVGLGLSELGLVLVALCSPALCRRSGLSEPETSLGSVAVPEAVAQRVVALFAGPRPVLYDSTRLVFSSLFPMPGERFGALARWKEKRRRRSVMRHPLLLGNHDPYLKMPQSLFLALVRNQGFRSAQCAFWPIISPCSSARRFSAPSDRLISSSFGRSQQLRGSVQHHFGMRKKKALRDNRAGFISTLFLRTCICGRTGAHSCITIPSYSMSSYLISGSLWHIPPCARSEE